MSSDGTFLAAAASIGRRIVDDAVWDDGRCSWMGAAENAAEPWRPKYRALEANLYDGTAGVGLFLAQLAAATGDPATRRTAVGALRHAVGRVSGLPPSARDGFHAGVLGIAWAAARAGSLLDEDELLASARAIAGGPGPPSRPHRCPDVIDGAAGAIIARLALSHALDDATLVDDAVATGEELIGGATVTRHGWAWALPERRHRRPLCGLSHGAAGIGLALLELFAATRDKRFAAGATGAFAYERSWLDAHSGTWPDLRIGGQRRGAHSRITSPAIGTWCHGEAGIAITRLRAIDVLGPEPYRREAELALDTTRRDLAATLPFEIDDLTLCHGAAGAADVLLYGAATLGERWDDAAKVAQELGRLALERYAGDGQDWPCGGAARTGPDLFRGLSGIGWWLLRLHDAAIPSPLTMPIRLTAPAEPA
jgi:class II lanthipeptide synthase